MISATDLVQLVQVILVDLVLAGDNAIVIALVVAGFAPRERARLLMLGVVAATVVRILFALVTTQLMQIVGLMLAGGLLLLWVCWKLWRDLESQRASRAEIAELNTGAGTPETTAAPPPKTLRQAITQIVIADVSMSLDNVIAVAGIARDNTWVLIVGLVLSIAFMAFAATFIARLLSKHHWVAYLGLAIILYVAVALIWDGAMNVIDQPAVAAALQR